MANSLFLQEANYFNLLSSNLSYSMTNPVFLPEQMIQLQNIIFRAVASAIEITFASQKEMNILFFYLNMLFLLCQDDKIYLSVTAFTIHLQEIVMKKNTRTIHEKLSNHLLNKVRK